MKKTILSILLIVSLACCCSCSIKQPVSKSKYIVEYAPFCTSSTKLIYYTLAMMAGNMDMSIYTKFANEGCIVTDANFPIEIIHSSPNGIIKIKMTNGTFSIIGYTFDDFICNY